MDFQSGNLAVEILKWVGIVFAAGFIGYFGRYLSMLLIERLRRKKTRATPSTEVTKEAPVTQETTPENIRLELAKQKAKTAKKKAKAEAKRVKKEGEG